MALAQNRLPNRVGVRTLYWRAYKLDSFRYFLQSDPSAQRSDRAGELRRLSRIGRCRRLAESIRTRMEVLR